MLLPDATHTHPVHIGTYTVYFDDEGLTATGAVPNDAALGFTPVAKGPSAGPSHRTPGCYEGPVPQQTSVGDHARWSAATLHQYGLPTQVELGVSYDDWAKSVRAATYMFCTTHTDYLDGRPAHQSDGFRASHPHPMSPTQPATNGTLFAGSIQNACPGNSYWCLDSQLVSGQYGAWQGWISDRVDCFINGAPAWCDHIVATEGYWHVPYVTPETGDTCALCQDASVAWQGIGGVYYNTRFCGDQVYGSLVQVGSESDTMGAGPGGLYFAWEENISDPNDCGAKRFDRFNIGSGDLMYAIIGGGGGAGIYLQDQTTGSTVNQPYGPGDVWPIPDQNTGECVAEVPAINVQAYFPYLMASYDFIHFEACRVSRNGPQPIEMGVGSMPGNTLLMARYYAYQSGQHLIYCDSTSWFDSYNSTYGYMSYYQWSNIPQDGNC